MKPTRLFLADDHAMFRKAMRIFLEQQPELSIVGEAGTGQATLDQLTRSLLALGGSTKEVARAIGG